MLFFSFTKRPFINGTLRRFVNIQARYPILYDRNKVMSVIYIISPDKQKEEGMKDYQVRSITQLKENLSETLNLDYLKKESELAVFHVVPTSFKINEKNEADVFGGHIASMLIKSDGSYIPESIMSKVTQLEPNSELASPTKDAQFLIGNFSITLKGQDYAHRASYHNEKSAPLFLTGFLRDKRDVEFGCQQYLVIIPLKYFTLTAETIIQNIKKYVTDQNHVLYKRQTDACGHAVMVAFGIETNKRGLTPQRAMLDISSKFNSEELRDSFLDMAAQSGLSKRPEQVYLEKDKISLPNTPLLTNYGIKLK